MKLGLQELKIIDSDQVWLAFSPEDEDEAWPSEGQYPYEAAYWNAYLNHLCLNAFITWSEQYLEFADPLKLWPNQDEFTKLWGFVNGTAIQLGEKRIVLIPSEAAEPEEFCVQREWIDIPSWVANYYVSVQVNPDSGWLRVLGYSTHKTLKQEGRYDQITRTYSLDKQSLIEDLNIMWTVRELSSLDMADALKKSDKVIVGIDANKIWSLAKDDEKTLVEPLPQLSQVDTQKLLMQLKQPFFCSPRLDIKFKNWGSILANESSRRQLYSVFVNTIAAAPSKTLVNLFNWFQRIFEAGWQPVEEILEPGGANLAFAFRSGQPFRKPTPNNPVTIHPVTEFLRPEHDEETRLKTADFLVQVDPNNSEAIATLIDLLHTSQFGWLRLKAAENLGRISVSNTEAINALTTVLHSSQDDDLRWQAALSLGRIDPSNPAGGVDRGRLIDLGMQVAGHPVALIIDIRPESDREVGVFLRVCPTGGQTYLPPNLELIVMDESGEVVDQAQARSADNWIQLQFSVEVGDRFSVKIALGDASYTQDFVN